MRISDWSSDVCSSDLERTGLVWIGNWGEGERTKELREFLFRPVRALGLDLDVYGVRYHETAKATVRRYGGRYHGWLPNAAAPDVFARHLATVHVPRSEEHTSELQSLMRISYAVFCLKKKNKNK